MNRLALITILIITIISACRPAPAPTPIADMLLVEPSTSLGPISPYLYGTNYGPMHAVPLDVLPLVENGGFTTLRFPGGAWTVKYGWESSQVGIATKAQDYQALQGGAMRIEVPFGTAGARPGISGKVVLVGSAWNV